MPRIKQSVIGAAALGVGVIIACAGEITDPDGYEPVGASGSATTSPGGSGMGSGGRAMSGSGGGSMATNGGTGNAGSGNADVCDAAPIITASCFVGSGCHGVGSRQTPFAVNEASLLETVGDRAIRNVRCTQLMIDPENPAQSLILLKALGTQDPDDCGDPMPPEGVTVLPLSQSQTDCLADWLTQFAN